MSATSEPRLPGPDHPIDVAPFHGQVRVTFADHTVADTTQALELREARPTRPSTRAAGRCRPGGAASQRHDDPLPLQGHRLLLRRDRPAPAVIRRRRLALPRSLPRRRRDRRPRGVLSRSRRDRRPPRFAAARQTVEVQPRAEPRQSFRALPASRPAASASYLLTLIRSTEDQRRVRRDRRTAALVP